MWTADSFRIGRAWLTHAPGATAGRALLIGSALSVALLLDGFMSGLLDQLETLPSRRGADLIVLQEGVRTFVAGRSSLPQAGRERLESVPGVQRALPMTMVPVIFRRDGRATPIFLLVYEILGGPSALIRGREPAGPNEAVLDQSLSAMYGIRLGDRFQVADYDFEVVGITAGEAALFTPLVFISYDDLIDLYFSSDLMGDIASLPLVSAYLIELAEGIPTVRAREDIEKAFGAGDVYTPRELGLRDESMGASLFGPILGSLTSVAYIICLLVVAMIVYAAVAARRRSYGVMMALGFESGQLFLNLLFEATILILMALPAAAAIAGFIAAAIEIWAPLYRVLPLSGGPLLRTGIAALVIALLATAFPYRRIARLDPAEAFSS